MLTVHDLGGTEADSFMHTQSRRDFLRLCAGGGLACAAKTVLPGCGTAPMLRDPLPLPNGAPVPDTATVHAVRGRDLRGMTSEIFQALGGAESVVNPGESVFIKPNFLSVPTAEYDFVPTGEITKPEIVVATAEECLKAGASEVIIGDGSQGHRYAIESIRTLDGTTTSGAEVARLNAAYAGNVTLACLNVDSPAWDRAPSPGTSFEHLLVSSLVTRADKVISIPVLKTHRHTGVSLSLKNFMGVIALKPYDLLNIGYRTAIHASSGGIGQCFLNVVKDVQPDLAIVDGSIGCEGYGPYVNSNGGKTVDLRDRLGDWVLLAGRDPVACDITAARVIGHDTHTVDHLQMAHEQGLGQTREDRIHLRGATLDELKMEWEPAPRRYT